MTTARNTCFRPTRVCHVFSTNMCFTHVFHQHLLLTCLQRVLCFPPTRVLHVFAACFPPTRVCHAFPFLAPQHVFDTNTCFTRVCHVFVLGLNRVPNFAEYRVPII